MNTTPSGGQGCEKVQRYLDSYIQGELLVETNHEVLEHLEQCPACRADHEQRLWLRNRLREASRTVEAPVDLPARVQRSIREAGLRSAFSRHRNLMLVAATILVAVFAGVLTLRQPERIQESYINRLSARLAGALRVGFDDHLHCAVGRKFPDDYPKPEQMKPQELPGPEFEPLSPVLRKLVPAKYEMVSAHRCSYKTRRFVHFIFRNEKQLISVVIAPKQANEGFQIEKLIPALRQAGLPVYQSTADRYQVAGFESGQYMAYLVSDLPAGENLALAQVLSQPVSQYLAGLKG